MLALDAAKISRVTIEIPGEEPLKIEREAAPAKDAKDAKDGKQANDTAAKLRFVGFPARRQEAEGCLGGGRPCARAGLHRHGGRAQAGCGAPGTGVSVVKVEVADGPTTTLRLRKDGDAHWLSIAATGEGEAKKAAEEITKRTQGWEFKIPGPQGRARS